MAKGLIKELGIDVPSYSKYVKKDLYRSLGLNPQIFFDKETFGADKLVVNPTPQMAARQRSITFQGLLTRGRALWRMHRSRRQRGKTFCG